jgi:hypothetical protein
MNFIIMLHTNKNLVLLLKLNYKHFSISIIAKLSDYVYLFDPVVYKEKREKWKENIRSDIG